MLQEGILTSFVKLKSYCDAEHYKGWDPYDGLTSKVFQSLPYFKNSAFWRLCVIQGFKRCPINLRRIFLVPKDYNAKGIGLFLQGYCNLVKAVWEHPELAKELGSEKELENKVNELADLLISLQSKGDYHGACWGYNFGWQAKFLFYFPAYTPTVVATNFCATALMQAYEVTEKKKYLDVALTSAEFVRQDLHRTEHEGGFLFSYSKFPNNREVLNASLLGSRLLSYAYKYTGNIEYKELARKSVAACCQLQEPDGSWIYGLSKGQSWVDSFHTGYNLDGIIAYQELTGDKTYNEYIEKGFKYYIDNFFEKDGTPKYYNNQTYPIDIHCPGQLLVTLKRLHKYDENKELAEKVVEWTIRNMQDKKGYFYYQLKKGISSKISYMRWSNAFMFCALSYLFTDESNEDLV